MVASAHGLVQRLSLLINVEGKAAFPSTAWTGVTAIYSVVFLQVVHCRRVCVHGSRQSDRRGRSGQSGQLIEVFPAELLGTGICLGRGNGADGKIIAQSYLVYIRNNSSGAEMTFAHRGGYYVMPTECFGSGIIY